MRTEPYTVESYLHVLNRGARKMDIVREESDKWRFLKLLRYLNDANVPARWERDITPELVRRNFERPASWPSQDPLVKVLAFCLMPNHFHLLLKEIRQGGVSKFMQKIGTSMSNHFNLKYAESGSIFEGSFKSRTVGDDNYLRWLAPYIMVKNPFELYPGGYEEAEREFDSAYQWAIEYPFCSLAAYAGERKSSIIDKEILAEITPEEFKALSKDMIEGRHREDLAGLFLEELNSSKEKGLGRV